MKMLDAYDAQARLAPALLACLPPIALAAVALGKFSVGATVVGLAALGLVVLIVARVREMGKAIEDDLYAAWGGIPTTRRLRWADATTDMAERHRRISQATDVSLPDQAAEAADPQAADQAYFKAIEVLRKRAGGEAFPTVASENRQYGFRRNTLGVKPVAIGIALGTAALGPLFWAATDRSEYMAGLVVALLVLPIWIWGAREAWVKVPADRYADELIAAGESLAVPLP